MTLAKTVAFPVIGLGLDANPLKAGLRDAKGAVAGSVNEIKASAKKLSDTPFVPKDIYSLKPELNDTRTHVLDVVDRFNQRRAKEVAQKNQEKQEEEKQKAAREAEKALALEKQAVNERVNHWNASITPTAPKASGSIPANVMDALQGLLFEEKNLKKATESRMAQRLENAADQVIKIRERLTSQVSGLVQQFSGSGLSRFFKSSGVFSLPGLAGSGALSAGRGLLSFGDAAITKIGRLPETLGKASIPINQSLELAAKVNRLFGGPLRSVMAMEAGNNQAVWEGGRSALNSNSWSGSLARFTVSVEQMFANIAGALDKTFNFKGWVEAARGASDAISRIIEGFFGPMDQASNNNNFEEMFTAGQDVAIELAQQMVEFLSNIYNSSLDAYEQLIYIYNALAHPFSEGAFYKSLHKDLSAAGLRDREGNKLGRIDIDKDVGGFFKGIRDKLADDRAFNELLGVKNFELDVNKKEQDDANKALKEMAKSALGASDAILQIENNFKRAEEEIDKLKNAGGNDVAVAAAREANAQQRDLAILEQLKPIMAANDNARFSQSFEMGSAALIESIMKAQMGAGTENPQERIAAAAEVQKDLLAQMKTTQDQMLAAIRQLPKNPAVMVGPIGP